MPERFFYLRMVVALLLAGFSYFLGRSLARRHRPGRRGTGPTSWGLRTVIALFGVTWRAGFDMLAICAMVAAAAAGVAGFFSRTRPKKIPHEDLTKEMFPDE